MAENLFAAKGIEMRFATTLALQNIDMEIRPGEIIGLVGENGAGKSTLLKIIMGVQQPTKGSMEMNGKAYTPRTPKEANKSGVGMVFQEQSLVANLTVGQNVFFGNEEPYRLGPLVNWSKMYRDTDAILRSIGVEGVRPGKKVADYDFATRQMIEIAKVINGAASTEGGSLILLDEPTSVLSGDEIEKLFREMRRLAQAGNGVIFVSHRLDEIIEISDRVYVFKDGCGVGMLTRDEVSEAVLYEKMVGRTSTGEYYKEERQKDAGEPVVLEVEDLGLYGSFKNVSFKLRRSEVLGICGVVGSGKEELCEVIAGVLGPTKGEIKLEGRGRAFRRACNAVNSGVVSIPKERREEGMLGSLSVLENMGISNLGQFSRLGLVSKKKQTENTRQWIRRLRIKCPGERALMNSLSGGNAQKVVFARALNSGAKVLILNHPTRGVDIGAKEEIYSLIRDVTDQGMAVIVLGDTLDECIGLSSRILVMKDGLVTREFGCPVGAKPEQVEIVKYMM